MKSGVLILKMLLMLSAGEHTQNVKALDMILKKIVEDPHSSSCPNISYQYCKGPVASSNPTRSPFTANPLAGAPKDLPNGAMNNSTGNMSNSMNNMNLIAAAQGNSNRNSTLIYTAQLSIILLFKCALY